MGQARQKREARHAELQEDVRTMLADHPDGRFLMVAVTSKPDGSDDISTYVVGAHEVDMVATADVLLYEAGTLIGRRDPPPEMRALQVRLLTKINGAREVLQAGDIEPLDGNTASASH